MGKKILIVAPYNSGTIAMCSRNLYLALRERQELEVKCVVVHRFKKDALPEFENCLFCLEKEAHPIFKWMNLYKQVVWLRQIKKSFKPDITISTLGGCSTINILSGGADKKVGIFHSPYWQEKAKGKLVYWNTLLNYRLVYPRLDRLACVSSEIKRSILENFHEYKDKDVRVVYNVHNFSDIIEKSKQPLTEEESYIVNNDTILYIGRFDRNKAPGRALKAFHSAIGRLPKEANLCYIGKDQEHLQPELDAFIQENDLQDRVHFLGFQTNPYRFLVRSKCLISCSYSEGLPGVMIESLLLGKPVITTNASEGIWEILSCHKYYKERLTHLYRSIDGIITTNNAFTDKNKYSEDVNSLVEGLIQMFNKPLKPSFFFKKKVDSNNTIRQLIE